MITSLSSFQHWDVVALLLSMLIIFGLEMLGVFGGKHYVTITYVVRTYAPRWALAMVWGWLGWHFLITGR